MGSTSERGEVRLCPFLKILGSWSSLDLKE